MSRFFKSFLSEFYVYCVLCLVVIGGALAVIYFFMPGSVNATEIIVVQYEATDAGCEAVEEALYPKSGGDDYRRAIRPFKGLTDFSAMNVITIPESRLKFNRDNRDDFINIYQLDPVQQAKAKNKVRFIAVTINGTVIPGANFNRPSPKDLHSVVRIVGDELTVFKIQH